MSEKKVCYSCNGRGYKMRTVVIGTVVTQMRDSCTSCRGTGKVD